eukprot:9082511-Pyramimonas_sp.AAC.1
MCIRDSFVKHHPCSPDVIAIPTFKNGVMQGSVSSNSTWCFWCARASTTSRLPICILFCNLPDAQILL